jgi:hypothetical protein
MNVAILLTGLLSFSFCLALHVGVWRVARPRSDVWGLFTIFLIAPAVLALLVLAAATIFPGTGLPDALEIAAMLLLHWALSSAYIQSYPAAQARSPSLEIAYAVVKSMPRGLSRDELLATVNMETLVQARVEDLVTDRLIRAEGERYVLTPVAAGLVRLFLGLRALLGLRNQGG